MNTRQTTAAVLALLLAAVTACTAPDGGTGREEAASLVVFLATTPDGGPPPAAALEQTAEILAGRFRSAGIDDVRVRVDDDRLVATFTGEPDEELLATVLPGTLAFRKVIAENLGFGLPPEPGTAAASPVAVQPGAPAPVADLQRAVEAKIDSEAMAAAFTLAGMHVADPVADPYETVAPFGSLTGAEVGVLPALLQFYVTAISCAHLDARPSGTTPEPGQLAVACDDAGRKLLLDVSRVHGTEVREATAAEQEGAQSWQVRISFTDRGQPLWTELTREATRNDLGEPFEPSRLGTGIVLDAGTGEWRFEPAPDLDRYAYTPDAGSEPIPIQCATMGDVGNCLVAMVLGHQVISAPQILEALPGDAVISRTFTEEEARQLAEQLSHGTLPLNLYVLETQVTVPS